ATGSFFVINFAAGVGVLVPPDQYIGTHLNKDKLLEGRNLDPRDPTEAVVSFTLADQYHLHLGSKIPVLHPDVLAADASELPPEEAAPVLAARRRILERVPDDKLTVVGIEASPNE